ncbi:hypothetical protein UO65_3666 [Actinokineospora spheciospongiae]|uniref:Uncharacterized protein n=1 Tax=Actinokineospora spheciospongiae TaxID=909613 RepID=W7IJK1_9PSEU|nr:hypothetical protein UO65_3666 [Actinokineospora spheciospongiae]
MGVGEQQPHGVVADRDQPGAGDGGTGAVHGHTAPAKRQPDIAVTGGGQVGETKGVQGGVEQGRVHAEALGVGRLGQFHLCQHLAAAAPRAPQALEHRAVGETTGQRLDVEAVHVEDLGVGGRPLGGGGRPGGLGGGERAHGVAHPRAVPDPGVDLHPPFGVDDHAQRDSAVLGQGERGLQGQLRHPGGVDLGTRAQGQVEERGARQQHRTQHGVVGQPRVGAQRQPPGEDNPVRHLDHGAHEGVVGGDLTQTGGVTAAVERFQPEVVVLERVGGQVHVHTRATEERRPVDRGPQRVGLAQSRHQVHRFRLVLALQRNPAGQCRQRRIRTDLDQHHAFDLLHSIVEPHSPPHLLHPVLRRGHLSTDNRHLGFVVGHRLRDFTEGRQHRVHVRGVKRVAGVEPLRPWKPRRQSQNSVFVTGNNNRLRAVHRSDRHTLGQLDLRLRNRNRHHRTTTRQPLHQRGPGRHQLAGILQRPDARHIRGSEFTDGVADKRVWPHTPRLHQPHHRDLEREDRGLRETGVLNGKVRDGQVLGDLVPRLGEHRVRLVQLTTHAQPLRTLTGEHQRRAAGARDTARRGAQGLDQFVPGGAHDHRAVLEAAPAQGQGAADLDRVQARVGGDGGAQAFGLRGQGVGGAGGEHPRHHRERVGGRGGLVGRGLQDDVGVGAADAERRHPGPPGSPGLRPRPRLGQQLHRAPGPVDVGGGGVDAEGLGQHAVSHGHDHLDHARDPGGGLGVADVGLHRPQVQRFLAVLPVGGQQRLRLDRIAERGPGAVRLHHVDVLCGQTGVGECVLDDPLLRRTVRRGQPVRRAVLVHRRAAHHGQHPVPVAAGVGEPFQQQHAHALGHGGAVGGLGERLDPAVGGQASLAAEVDERVRGGHHGHPARQRQVAVAVAQRPGGQVQGDQRRRAGGVHGDRRPLQSQGVGDPAGDDAGRRAGAQVALQVVGHGGQAGDVTAVHGAREHPGPAAAHGRRVDARPLEDLPRRLQQQALLRVHRQRLARGDAEERRVEQRRARQETALAGVGGAQVVGVVVEQGVGGPAPVGRERHQRVGAPGQQSPQVLGGGDPTGVAAAHRHHGHRLVGRAGAHHRAGRGRGAAELVAQVRGQGGRGRVVEDQGGGQAQAQGRAELVAQLDGGQRVEAEVLEGQLGGHGVGGGVAEHPGDVLAHQLQQGVEPFGRRQPGEPGQGGGAVGGGGRGPAGGPDQAAQQRGHRVGGGGAHGGQVELDRDQQRPVGSEGSVEQGQALLGGQPARPGAGHPGHVGVGEVPAHGAALGPIAPGQGHPGQPGGAAAGGQVVEEGVGGGVVALARAAEHPGGGGEQDERGQVEVAGQLVEQQGRVDLGAQHPGDPLGVEGFEGAVVEHARAVHDHRQRVRGGHPGQQRGQRRPVGGVAGGHGHLRAQGAQLGGQFGGTLGVGAATAGQQQVADAVHGDQVAGHQRTERAGATGDQGGAVRVQGGRGGAVDDAGARQPAGQHLPVAQHQLGFPGGQGGGDQPGGGSGAPHVEQDEPAGVLGLGSAHQAVRGGVGRVVGGAGEQDQRQLGGLLPDQPRLEPVQHGGGQGGRVEAGGHLVHLGLCGGVGHRHRGPVHLEQRVADHGGGGPGGELVGGGGQQHQGVHGGDGTTRAVGHPQGDPTVDRGQPHAQRRGTGGEQPHPGPGERQAHHPGFVVAEPAEPHAVQGGVEQRRVQAEPGGLLAVRLGQGDLGAHVGTVAPRGPQALERRAVTESDPGQLGVEVLRGQFFGAGRGPGGEVEVGCGGGGGDRAGGVPGPRAVFVGAGVDGDRSGTGAVGGAHGDLHGHGVVGEQERRFEGQVLDRLAAHPGTGVRGQLDEGRAGEQDTAPDGVVGQPRVRAQGQPARQQQAVRVREGDRGTQQGVVGAELPVAGRVADDSGGVEPVPLPLERVGGQVHQRTRGHHGRPVDGGAVGPRLPQAADNPVQTTLIAAQAANDTSLNAGVLDHLGNRHGQHRVRRHLHHDSRARQRSTQSSLELHRLPHVAVPVLGIHPGGVEQLAGHRGEERDLRGDRANRRHVRQKLLPQLIHLRRVPSGVHTGNPPSPNALGLELRDHHIQRGRIARDSTGTRAVHRSDGEHIGPLLDPLAHLIRRGENRRHATLARQGQPQLRPQSHNASRVSKRQAPGDVCGSDLTLRVAHHRSRLHTERLPHTGQRHHHREQHRLHNVDALQRLTSAQDVRHRPIGELPKSFLALRHRRGEHRRGIQQLPAHGNPLRPLTGEHEDHPVPRLGGGDLHSVVAGEQDGALGEGGAAGQGPGHVRRVGRGGGAGLGQCGGLGAHGVGGAGGQQHRNRPGGGGSGFLGGFVLGHLLQHHVRVGAAEAERRHPGPAGLVGVGVPRALLGE